MVTMTLSAIVVVLDCRMATMALSACCSLLLASVDQYPDLFRFIWFLLSMVTLTLSPLVIPFVACCSVQCRVPLLSLDRDSSRIFGGTLSLSIDRSMLRSQPVLLSGLLALSVVEASHCRLPQDVDIPLHGVDSLAADPAANFLVNVGLEH
jgi:hypothetical protein